MTIKEIEAMTGMTRANIRYYESEGLITPRRQENGYRVYSNEDGQHLLKIRLLRCLDISIEELKAIQAGEKTMEEALRQSLDLQREKQSQIGRCMEITQRMLAEKAAYETVDAAVYLRLLESEEVLKQDRVPARNHPWRRLFARDLDNMLCATGAVLLFYDFLYSQVVTLLASLVLMLLMEPMCLHFFGTTPGKWIFGIRVTDTEEQRLSYGAGLERTWTVLWEGEALRIPLIMHYFLYKSYKTAEAGEPLPWEWDSELSYRDDKVWRWALCLLVYLAVIALQVIIVLWKEGLI